ncbi:respiratory nitrate reductase subunit gamma [Corynebacterium canis]|uniref:Nitrate reductase-like protein NarX n=1 Tax=Corynebacterium canis TaxID=679663 RepID=A0A5C5UQS2_9CORY|nr:respiratory nitrate reductase subunit gamma [Corynebacterium canis]TWT28831.1 respiratory nitrate reductase subunit gamma [Corynebacterium canis]WJY74964.1 Nitrate reductase-like protein NarX [Corynebacterium canis]
MTSLDTFLWVAFPWLALAVFIIGSIWRWRYDQFGWTTKSSQIYESKLLRLSSPVFHYGMLGVIVGHVVGLAIPKSWTLALGISEAAYHFVAAYIGTLFGIAAVLGLLGLLYRRFVVKTVHLATSIGDKIMYLLLGVAILLGFFATVSTQIFGDSHGYDYRETISPWFRSVFAFQPQPELMADVPLAFKLHIIAGLILFIAWPFTRLVHVFSAPVGYATRPYVVYRSREATMEDHQRAG